MQRSLFSSVKNHHTTLRKSSGFVTYAVTVKLCYTCFIG